MGEYNKQNEYEEKNKRVEGKTLRTNISQHAYSICFGFYLTTKHLRIISFPLKKKTGASWPAIHPMTAVWIPPMDRSKFMANMMASALGAAITMPICGYLIEYVNWQSVFYVTGK